MLFTPYTAPTNSTIAKYRAPTLRETVPMMNPTIATAFEMVMCHVRSLNLPDDHETATEMKAESK